jgi:hypothetical protein
VTVTSVVANELGLAQPVDEWEETELDTELDDPSEFDDPEELDDDELLDDEDLLDDDEDY